MTKSQSEKNRQNYLNHLAARRSASIRYYHAHEDEKKAYMRRKREEYKRRVFENYGQICIGCGESDPNVLTVDHVNGGGTKHRISLGTGWGIYKWLVDHGFPDGFRILCFNCNCGRARRGIPLPNEMNQ